MSNKDVWHLIARGAKKGYLSFVSPDHNKLTADLCRLFSLISAHVTLNSVDDVASRGAHLVIDLIKRQARENAQREIHIGFSGGHTVRRLFRILALLLSEPSSLLPPKIVFHALVAGFATAAPGTDPTSFFSYLADRGNPNLDTSFVLFHAPPIVPPGQLDDLLNLPAIKEARSKVSDVDIFVTSAASFSHDHSQLKEYYATYSPLTVERLSFDGCVGDMLWLPFNGKGPIVTATYPHRAVTLLELDDLPHRLECGKKVVLVLGPCAVCGVPKTEVLDAILNFPKRYISHLVTDARTAQDLLDKQFMPPLREAG